MSEPKPLASQEPTDIANRYQIVSKLGAGAFGTVYKARDRVLGRMVAIKTIRMDGLAAAGASLQELLDRFEREAQVSAQLRHPNIVTIHDIGKDGELSYLAMEFIDGVGLERVIAQEKRLNVARACALCAQVADALDFAHKNGVVHRDIKPANIMVEDGDRVKVTDFGIAKVIDSGEHLTMTGSLLGTPSYMSPEQARGVTIDGRSDLFAVGCILYELVAGQKAFRGDSITGLIFKIITEEPPPVQQLTPDLPEELVRIVNKALSKAPETRYQSGRELKDDLLRLTAPGVTPTLRIGDTPTAPGGLAALPAAALQTISSSPTAIGGPATQVSAATAAGATVVTPPPPVAAAPRGAVPARAAVARSPVKKGGIGVGVILAVLFVGGFALLVAGAGVWWFFLRAPAETPLADASPSPTTETGGTTADSGGQAGTGGGSGSTGGGWSDGTPDTGGANTGADAGTGGDSGGRRAADGGGAGADRGAAGSGGARTADAGRRGARADTETAPDTLPPEVGDGASDYVPPDVPQSDREAGSRLADAYSSKQRGPWGRDSGASSGGGARFRERARVPPDLSLPERAAAGVLTQINNAEKRFQRDKGRYGTLAELHEAGLIAQRAGPGVREFVQQNYSFSVNVEDDGYTVLATPRGGGLRGLQTADHGFIQYADE